MKRCFERLVISAVVLFMLIGCGGGGGGGNSGDSSGGGIGNEDGSGNPVEPTDPFEADALDRVLAEIQVDCREVRCPGADSVSSLIEPDSELARCTWNCVTGAVEGETRLFLVIIDYIRRDPQVCFEEPFVGVVERDTDCIPSL